MSTAGRYREESLDVLIQRITNPLEPTYDPQLVYAFCERVKHQQDGAVAATRLLAYRVQSPQEREAMLALDLLDTCARTGGPGFQAELGKFRFLNELIKLLSPRYLGSRTPQRVKQRVADLLCTWASQIPQEGKIQEAFSLLQKQGLLEAHGITPRLTGGAAARTEGELTVTESADVALDPHRPPTPPLPPSDRPANPIFEDGQKAALLRRLLQSTDPEDIQAANRLIKTMVKQDEERSERVSRRVTELETVSSNLRLLHEMMDSYSPETTSRDELELMSELCSSCEQLRGKLDSLAAEADDQDSALADLVSASEQIGATLSRHKSLLSSGAAPLTLLQLESPQEPPPPGDAQETLQRQLERLGLCDSPGATGAPSVTHPPDLLSQPTAAPPVMAQSVPAAPPIAPDLFSQPAAAPPMTAPLGPLAPPMTASQGPLALPAAVPVGPGLADLLGPVSVPAPVPPQTQTQTQTAMASIMAQQLRPQMPAPPPRPVRSAFDDLDDLVRLSMSTSTAAGPDKLPLAQTAPISTNQNNAPNATPGHLPPSTNHTPPLSPGHAAGAELNRKQPMTDLFGDDVSLLSTLSGPSSHDSLLVETGSSGGQEGSAGGQAGSGGGHGPASGDALTRDRPDSLAELAVSLEDIRPGVGAPLPLFSEPDSLEISLHPAGNRPRDDVTVYVITALNRTGRAVTQYTLQAVCDKRSRVRLQAPSCTELPAGSPFLPPPAASQVLLLARLDCKLSVHLRFMLSYSVDGDVVTEMAEATLPDQS